MQEQWMEEDKAGRAWPIRIPKGSPTEKVAGSIRALPKWGGGSRPLPGWFGALVYRRIVHVQRGICLFWGGLNPCQDGLGHSCSENAVKMHLLKSARK